MRLADEMYVNARAIIERSDAGHVEVLLQVRDKPGQRRQWELPGGQVEDHEPLLDALRREVGEETGLEVTEVSRQDTRVVSSGDRAIVECVRPFATYQTLQGPVASMGLYFRCRALGTVRPQPGESGDSRWWSLDDLRSLLDRDAEQFSWFDRAGLAFCLSHVLSD